MQKNLWIILVCLSLVLGTGACRQDSTPDVKEYMVVQVTGLYDEFSLNAAQIRGLAPGTKLIPADGAAEATCEALGEIALCHVQVVDTGEVGWVESERIIEN